MIREVEFRAPAKLNLRLRILARELSGYHQIETLFAALDWGDRLRLTWDSHGDGVELEVSGADLGAPARNLAHRAATAYFSASGIRGGVRIRLEKEVPVGGGLGGGSSDAGMVLRALNSLAGEPLEAAALSRLAGELGADVPFFLSPVPFALAWGRGDRILPLPPPEPAPVVLALPPVQVETPWAYGLLDPDEDMRPEGATHDVGALGSWEGLSDLATNDFEPVLFRHHPLLQNLKEAISEEGAHFALLSGSGSSLFGVFGAAERADRAADRLRKRFPEVRFVVTRTRTEFPQPREEGRPGDIGVP